MDGYNPQTSNQTLVLYSLNDHEFVLFLIRFCQLLETKRSTELYVSRSIRSCDKLIIIMCDCILDKTLVLYHLYMLIISNGFLIIQTYLF